MTEYAVGLYAAGAVIAASLIAWFASYRVAEISRRANEQSARLQSAIRIAEFRQEWINSLRCEISQLYSLMRADKPEIRVDRIRAAERFAKIQLFFPPGDEDHAELVRTAEKIINKLDKDHSESIADRQRFLQISQEILKREWDRLKEDVREAKI